MSYWRGLLCGSMVLFTAGVLIQKTDERGTGSSRDFYSMSNTAVPDKLVHLPNSEGNDLSSMSASNKNSSPFTSGIDITEEYEVQFLSTFMEKDLRGTSNSVLVDDNAFSEVSSVLHGVRYLSNDTGVSPSPARSRDDLTLQSSSVSRTGTPTAFSDFPSSSSSPSSSTFSPHSFSSSSTQEDTIPSPQLSNSNPSPCKENLGYDWYEWDSDNTWWAWTHNYFTWKLATYNLNLSYSQNGSYPTNEQFGRRSFWLSLVIPRPMDNKVYVVEFGKHTCTHVNYLTLYDGFAIMNIPLNVNWTGCETVRDVFHMYQTVEFTLTISITINDFSIPYSVQLLVRSVPRWQSPWKTKLDVFYQTPKLGFIQTIMWDPLKGIYVSYESAKRTAQVFVPADHLTLFGYVGKSQTDLTSALPCQLMLSSGGFVKDMWLHSYRLSPIPDLSNITYITCHWTPPAVFNLGFKAIFSFHEVSTAPEKTDSGRWNCSVSFWEDFKYHFLCNKLTECEALEDEAQCDYVQCRPGVLAIKGRCFKLNRPKKFISHHQADRHCQRQGGRLTSLQTPQKLADVTKAFHPGYTWRAFVGSTTVAPGLPPMYKHSHQWQDFTMNYHSNVMYFKRFRPACGLLLSSTNANLIKFYDCHFQISAFYICELAEKATDALDEKPKITTTLRALSQSLADLKREFVTCPRNYVTHSFLTCDTFTECWQSTEKRVVSQPERVHNLPAVPCAKQAPSLPPYFTCRGVMQYVPYTLVCDWRHDCQDGSDEDFCVFPPCDGDTPLQCGQSLQCYSLDQWCNQEMDCVNSADEITCDVEEQYDPETLPPPAVVNFIGRGRYTVTPLNPQLLVVGTGGSGIPDSAKSKTNGDSPCPETHFQCADDGYCLPVYVRCNRVADCPGREDEEGCESFTCAGFYRCRRSEVCLHPSQVCDGWSQCPQRDDELLCNFTCPPQCTCHGLALTCPDLFPSHLYPQLRYLDASDSGLTPSNLTHNLMLIHLSLRGCHLRHLANLSFPSLRSVDLRDNLVPHVVYQHLSDVRNLQVLLLASNPLTSVFVDKGSTNHSSMFTSLHYLDLSHVTLPSLDLSIFSGFTHLRHLNLSECRVQHLQGTGFRPLKWLRVLDLRGSGFQAFPHDVFEGLQELQVVYADNHKLCCPAVLPEGFDPERCHSPPSVLSSCGSLLRASVYQRLFVFLTCLCCLGNVASLLLRFVVYRSVRDVMDYCPTRTTRGESGGGGSGVYGVYISHLTVSDFLMGLYQVIILVADHMYHGVYAFHDNDWRSSAMCKMTGVLAQLSKFASVWFVFLITVDGVLKDRFLQRGLASTTRRVHMLCAGSWVGGIFLVIALPGMASHWQVYRHTSVCSPLVPSSFESTGRDDSDDSGEFSGSASSDHPLVVSVVLNSVLLSLTAVGQISLLCSRCSNTLYFVDGSARSQNLVVTRRSCLLCMVQCLSFLPVTVMSTSRGLARSLSGHGTPLLALVVWPLTSALNPYLYGLEVMRERQRQGRKELLLQRLKVKVKQKARLSYRPAV